jgi:hypothetical protein
MSREAKQQEEAIKKKIVDGYRRGVCDHNGCHIPLDKRGMAGKGSHFVNLMADNGAKRNWDENYRLAFGHD